MDPYAPDAPHLEPHGSVLCIEDDPVSRQLVEALLEPFPAITLRQASSGRDGIRAALDAMPDLILLDMNMPDLDGVAVVRALSPRIADGSCQVVLLTSETFTIDVIKAMSLGAREYWLKPLTRDRLRGDLQRILHAAPSAPAPEVVGH